MSLFDKLSRNVHIRTMQMIARQKDKQLKSVIPQTTSGHSQGVQVQTGGFTNQLETKGDLLTFSDVDAILGVGANDKVLTADSAQALGIKWAALAAALWQRTGTVLTPFNAGDTVEIAQTSNSGNALRVYRDLASGDTNDHLVFIWQDNSGDDKRGLYVINDGSGSAIQALSNSGFAVRGVSATGDGIRGDTNSGDNDKYGGVFDHAKIENYLDFNQVSAPAAAEAGEVRNYALADGLRYARDDDTVGIFKLSNHLGETAKTGAYTALTSDEVITCDASGGAFTITLYPVSGNAGRVLHIIKTDSSVNKVTIDGNSAETINGSTTYDLIIKYETVKLWCNGTEWFIL